MSVRFVVSLLAVVIFLFPAPPGFGQTQELTDRHQLVLDMYKGYKEDFPDVQDIKAQNAIMLHSIDRAVFVDVRKKKEQEVSMISGAITKRQFVDNLDQYRGKIVIAYCTISYRSGKFAEKMAKKGVTITNLEGGLLAWVHAGGKLTTDGRPTTRLHVYGRKWDLAPDGMETVH